MILLTPSPLDHEGLTSSVQRPANGAVVTFLGTTRDQTEGRQVRYLEYEAYDAMAQQELTRIQEEMKLRWGITDVVIAHRLGRLEIGEISLVVAVAAPHREEAFAACQYAVDRIKETVPIWKKEHFVGGEAWIGSEKLAH
ncbi:MAG: molybdenum cofactor biosynthesis protein MoaE [Chloroflexi bacterium]|nr:molybdenum cofactor biosynthesis protein MoaE [Chloroflexota bacterium]